MDRTLSRRRTTVGPRGSGLPWLLALPLFIFALTSPALTDQAWAAGAVSATVDPGHGYPDWYEDATGLRLQLCLDHSGNCLEPVPNPLAPAKVCTEAELAADPSCNNFPEETFWWAAEAELTTPRNGRTRVRLIMAAEAAFGGAEEIVDGNQITFGRHRIVARGLTPNGFYKFETPYAVIRLRADGRGDARTLDHDVGCEVTPCDFSAALASVVFQSFLRHTGVPATSCYIGDLQDKTVTGSPLVPPRNYFRMVRTTGATSNVVANGPVVPGELNTTRELRTNLFSVLGKKAGCP